MLILSEILKEASLLAYKIGACVVWEYACGSFKGLDVENAAEGKSYYCQKYFGFY